MERKNLFTGFLSGFGLLFTTSAAHAGVFPENKALFLKQACNVGMLLDVIAKENGTTLETAVHLETPLHASPNPNNGDFMLTSSAEGKFNVHDSQGQLVRTISITKENNLKIRVEGLQSGIYYITGTVNNKPVTHEVMVIR